MAEQFGSSVQISKETLQKIKILAAKKYMKLYEVVKESIDLFEEKYKNENISNQV